MIGYMVASANTIADNVWKGKTYAPSSWMFITLLMYLTMLLLSLFRQLHRKFKYRMSEWGMVPDLANLPLIGTRYDEYAKISYSSVWWTILFSGFSWTFFTMESFATCVSLSLMSWVLGIISLLNYARTLYKMNSVNMFPNQLRLCIQLLLIGHTMSAILFVGSVTYVNTDNNPGRVFDQEFSYRLMISVYVIDGLGSGYLRIVGGWRIQSLAR